MQEIKDYPPNWNVISLAFPLAPQFKAVFPYGDKMYNPFNEIIYPDIELHETIHSKQQGNDPEGWWFRYIQDTDFRREQEIQAYGAQYRFLLDNIPNTRATDTLLDELAGSLSSELYGKLLSFGEARSKIRNYAKKLKK